MYIWDIDVKKKKKKKKQFSHIVRTDYLIT